MISARTRLSSERFPACARVLACIVIAMAMAMAAATVTADEADSSPAGRQSLGDAWWTGPILASGAGTLPHGHALVEPYLFDVVRTGHYDSDGHRRSADRDQFFGSLTYVLYGVTDRFTAGLIPTFGFVDVSNGRDSSAVQRLDQ